MISPDSLAVTSTAVWVASSAGQQVIRLDPRTGKVAARIKVGLGPSNPAVAPDGSIFVPNHLSGTVSRIDPDRNRVGATLKVGPKPFPAAQAFGNVWVPVSGGSEVVRIHVG
jgi:YVTN family beta-propeller protein